MSPEQVLGWLKAQHGIYISHERIYQYIWADKRAGSDKVFTIITADNSKEFAGHKTMSKELNAKVYFAHPYFSWERGLNENTNGLIRQYFPKGSGFETITDEQVEAVMPRLNHRPRKGCVTKHLMWCFLRTLNAKQHELWNCIYDLNKSNSLKMNDFIFLKEIFQILYK